MPADERQVSSVLALFLLQHPEPGDERMAYAQRVDEVGEEEVLLNRVCALGFEVGQGAAEQLERTLQAGLGHPGGDNWIGTIVIIGGPHRVRARPGGADTRPTRAWPP